MTAAPANRILVGALVDPWSTGSLNPSQWSSLIQEARSANLLGSLAERLHQAGMEAEPSAKRHLDGARQLGTRQRQSVLWEIHRLQIALSKLQVPIVLLKGAAYVISDQLIARGRLFGDIDILVPRQSLGDVESQLMLNGWVTAKSSAYDQQYYRKWMHELPPMVHIHRGTVLDVHHNILPLTARSRPDSDKIIARSNVCTISGLDVINIPSHEDLVIHSMTHLVHEGELNNGLRDLYDIDGMLRGFSGDSSFWKRLTNNSVTNDLAWPVLFGLILVQMVFSTPVPAEVLAELSARSGNATPNNWLKAIYAKALPAHRAEGPTTIANVARSFIYVRAHAMRMPIHMLARHLLIKAWMRMFATPNEQNQRSH